MRCQARRLAVPVSRSAEQNGGTRTVNNETTSCYIHGLYAHRLFSSTPRLSRLPRLPRLDAHEARPDPEFRACLSPSRPSCPSLVRQLLEAFGGHCLAAAQRALERVPDGDRPPRIRSFLRSLVLFATAGQSLPAWAGVYAYTYLAYQASEPSTATRQTTHHRTVLRMCAVLHYWMYGMGGPEDVDRVRFCSPFAQPAQPAQSITS
ncbi:hypothetical protein GGR56DRAFT_569683 [Xylariaceae sp. FL0804]|nr:hypothetical protein GGR56DRAFT_569683 [Xylariaceae sp. FL0804]